MTKSLQLRKIFDPKELTLSGIVILVRLTQPEKAPFRMLVTLLGITMFVRLEQPLNV